MIMPRLLEDESITSHTSGVVRRERRLPHSEGSPHDANEADGHDGVSPAAPSDDLRSRPGLGLRRQDETVDVESLCPGGCARCRTGPIVELWRTGQDPEVIATGVADDRP